MKGYKIFQSDWTCRGKQYAVGQITQEDGDINLCHKGLHFCQRALDCLRYYELSIRYKYAEVEAIGKTISKENTSVTNELKVLKELTFEDFQELCTGQMETFDFSGKLMIICDHVKGLPEGLYQSWHPNGQAKSKCYCVKGVLEGLCETWYENGQPKLKCNYRKGKREGLAETWCSDGQAGSRCNYVEGELEGLCELWEQNPPLIHRYNYADGYMISEC